MSRTRALAREREELTAVMVLGVAMGGEELTVEFVVVETWFSCEVMSWSWRRGGLRSGALILDE